MQKYLVLSTFKESALKDLLITAPEMMSAAFSESSIIKSFVSSGMLDEKCKRCAGLHGIINSFKVGW